MEKKKLGMRECFSKGQAALEFLMTYGWAILVVLGAIAALSYFGVLNPSKFLPDKCLMEAGFNCVSSKVETDKVTVIISNGIGKAIDVYAISVSSPSQSCSAAFEPPTNLVSGEQAMINWSGCTNGNSGESFKGNVVLSYTERNPGGVFINKTATGEIASKIQ